MDRRIDVKQAPLANLRVVLADCRVGADLQGDDIRTPLRDLAVFRVNNFFGKVSGEQRTCRDVPTFKLALGSNANTALQVGVILLPERAQEIANV